MEQKMFDSISAMLAEHVSSKAMKERLTSVRSKILDVLAKYEQAWRVIDKNEERYSPKGITEQKELLSNKTRNALFEILESIGGISMAGREFIDKITSKILDACQAAGLNTKQTSLMVKGFSGAEGKAADHVSLGWSFVDDGLLSIMSKNDELLDHELKTKSKRLKCLSDFAETLRLRVNERIRGMAVGPIELLFTEFFNARNKVDETTN